MGMTTTTRLGRHAVLLVAGLVAQGCATTLSTLQTGKTLEPGHVRVAAGMGFYVPAGQAVKIAGEGTDLMSRMKTAVEKNQPFTWTADDEQTLLTTGVALAVLPPSSMAELSLRVGVIDNLDVGLRYSTNALRLDAKFRFFHDGEEMTDSPVDPKGRSTDLAVFAGGSKYLFKNPIFDALEFVKMGEFSRWDVEGGFVLSHDFNKYLGVYGAPKYLFSRTTMDETLVRVTQDGSGIVKTDVAMPAVVDMHFVGATAGLRVGIPQVSLFLELTFGTTFAKPMILGARRDLGGATLYPAGGIAVSF